MEQQLQQILQRVSEESPLFLPAAACFIGFMAIVLVAALCAGVLGHWYRGGEKRKNTQEVRLLSDLLNDLPAAAKIVPDTRRYKDSEVAALDEVNAQMVQIANSLPKVQKMTAMIKGLPRSSRKEVSGNIAAELLQMFVDATAQEMEAVMKQRNIELTAALADTKSDVSTKTSLIFLHREMCFIAAAQQVRLAFEGQFDPVSQRQAERVLQAEFRRIEAAHAELLAKIEMQGIDTTSTVYIPPPESETVYHKEESYREYHRK